MPLEPLPWNRKDFFKERKHDRSCSDSLGGGGGGGGSSSSFSRWRDSHGSSRWGSAAATDFRRPSGHGKQGGLHLSCEESGQGFGSSRSNDKILDDEGYRSSGSRAEGKYSRNNRETKGSFGQKDWRGGHSWDLAASPSGLARSSALKDQRSVDDALACISHPPHSDFVNTWDQPHLKGHHDKNSGVNGLSTGHRYDRENSLGSIDWKPVKWTRSGSLSSRSSGFSHSSSSRSMGVDLGETKAEVQPRFATPLQSPSGDAAACVTSTALSDETCSRKKPRLGWGEGLAKYEKKKVDGPDDSVAKNGVIGSADLLPSHGMAEKSPRVAGFSDCASPATPSSVACSSSPGMDYKTYARASNVDIDTSNLRESPGVVNQNQSVGLPFNLENLELTQMANLSSSLGELLQSDDLNSPDSDFASSTAMNKLLIWKGDISKALEVTESEIDLLENELKLFTSQTANSRPCPGAYGSLPAQGHTRTCEELGSASTVPFVCSEDVIMEDKIQADDKEKEKGEVVESLGAAMSRFVELPCLRKDDTPLDKVIGECSGDSVANRYGNIEGKVLVQAPKEEKLEGDSRVTSAAVVSSDYSRENVLFDFILAANKDSANRASEILNKLLPSNQCAVDIPRTVSSSCGEIDDVIMENFASRRRFLKFKERVVTLKFRAFQQLWKEDMRLLSLRKYRAKSQKRLESSLQPGYCFQKHRSSIRSRYSSPGGNLSLVPNVETINFMDKLLSDSQVKLYRNSLKMPAMILDKNEKSIWGFISSNGLVEDPCAVEKERSMINPWTKEEREIFIKNLSTFGKDFSKIASFLDHKTTADCVEFYYKNHKSDGFEKTKKKPDMAKQGKTHFANTYLVTSGKRWNREVNAASLDMLRAASAIAAGGDDDLKYLQKNCSRFYFGVLSDYKARCDDATLERSSSHDIFVNDRETVAADVLAGICGSLSSEAMSSCITSSVDPGEGYPEWKSGKVGSSTRQPVTPEVTTQAVDDETCSDESCGEMDPHWTDEEKSIFIQAVSSYGKDFVMIAQCVRTKSRDQCKIFFSKARKCLGLDMIHTAHGGERPLVSDDANGGGSDTEDACIVETGSAICCDKSDSKMDEDLPLSDVKVGCEEDDPSSAVNFQTDVNRSDCCYRIEKLDCNTELGAEDLGCDDGQRDVELVLDGGGNTLNCSDGESVAVLVNKSDVIASYSECGQDGNSGWGTLEEPVAVIEGSEHGLGTTTFVPIIGTNAINAVATDNSVTEILEQKLTESCLSDKQVDKGSASDTTELNCGQQDLQSAINASHIAVDISTCSHYQHKPALDLDATQNSHVTSSLQENSYVPTNSASHDLGATHIENICTCGVSPTQGLEVVSDQRCQKSYVENYQQNLSESSLLSSQILEGYPLPMSSREMNGDIHCKKEAPLKSITKLDKSFHSDRYLAQDCYLQKCNSSKHHSSIAELPLLSTEQMREHSRPPLHGSSDSERPRRNGDVRLFGQILSHPSSQQKSAHENEDSRSQHPKLSGRSFNLKFNGNQGVDGNSASGKFDRNSYLGFENFSMRSSQDFWDGNKKLHTGFSSLPDSAVLLAKYPAAFGNYSTSSSRMNHQSLHTVAKSNERPVNGKSVFSSREASSRNDVADFQMYRGRDGSRVQPFTLEMNMQQDLLLSEMQKRKGFESASMQQQAKGMGGINVVGRGSIFVGGPCTGVSDPVAAIRMHYAKAEQYSGQTGGLFREEEWRGKGDIGR